MRRLIAIAVVWAAAYGAALAQQPAGKPYAPVAASYDRSADDDAELAAVVKSLRAIVEARDATTLSSILSEKFVALECSASPLKPCAPGKAKALGKGRPIERMRLAFCCEGKPSPDMPEAAQNETMFAILAADLAVGGLGANPDAKGEVCAPALPRIDRAKAAAAAKAAGVEPENLRVASSLIGLRARPGPDAPQISRLDPRDLAPIVTDLTANTPSGWNAIGLPDGSIGFTDALGLDELTPAAVCFGKEGGRWRIVSTIQRGG